MVIIFQETIIIYSRWEKNKYMRLLEIIRLFSQISNVYNSNDEEFVW